MKTWKINKMPITKLRALIRGLFANGQQHATYTRHVGEQLRYLEARQRSKRHK